MAKPGQEPLWESRVNKGIPFAANDVGHPRIDDIRATDSDLIGKFLATREENTSTTRYAYQIDLTGFAKHLGLINKGLRDATTRDVQSYIQTSQKPATVNRHLTSLRGFYSWMHQSGNISANPTEGIPGIRKRKGRPTVLTIDQIRALNEVIKPYLESDKPIEVRNACFVLLALRGGLKVSEIANLKVKDLSDAFQAVTVEGKPPVGRTIVHLHPTLSQALKATHLELKFDASVNPALYGDQPLFPKERKSSEQDHISRQTISLVVTEIGEAAGIEGLNPNTLRHTAAAIRLNSVHCEKVSWRQRKLLLREFLSVNMDSESSSNYDNYSWAPEYGRI